MSCADTPPRRSPGRSPSRGPRLVAALAALFVAVPALAPPAALAAPGDEAAVTVLLDRAQVMRFPPTTETVIVGNPIIADITMLKNSGEVILTGRGYGETNLLFLDGTGRVLSETTLRVREAPSMMVVQRGADRETYACQPRCQPTVTLGDSGDFLKNNIGAVRARNGLASGAAAGGAAGQ